MAKSKSESPLQAIGSTAAPRPQPNWIVAVICGVLAIYLTLSLIDYDVTQSTIRQTSPTSKNLMGWLGADIIWCLLYLIGAACWWVPIFLGWAAYLGMRNARRLSATRIGAMIVSIIAITCIAAMFDNVSDYFPNGPGGDIGQVLFSHVFSGALGGFGTMLLMGTTYVIALMFIFTKDIGKEFEKALAALAAWKDSLSAERKEHAEALAVAPEPKKVMQEEPKPEVRALVLEPIGPTNKNVLIPKGGEMSSFPTSKTSAAAKIAALKEAEDDKKGAAKTPVEKPKKIELNIVKQEEPKKARIPIPINTSDNYKFPPLKLLKEQVKVSASSSEEEHRINAGNLLRILGEFGVEVSLGEIHVGPVITRYELIPAPGVRVEKISGLDKNIALGMRAQSVRILAPIPGKAAVGVEVPNTNPTPVGLREILESEDWVSAKAELPIALGKDVSGKALISDLTKMPHLLIAGATGSGKSVCINAVVASILYSKSPKDVRLLMVDPKVVELKIFNRLPHMLIPVVTEPKKVPGALKWLLSEMEQRYQIFAKVNVRNIVGFNTRKKHVEPEFPAEPAQGSLAGLDPLAVDDGLVVPDKLPYIVVIIDELADLMMVAPAEIESNVARLAQLARAAGIHLIIATQRPSVDVITGVIKANLPSRIAFQVASQIDSRTILDQKGAETLIGRGDMLFTPPGTSRIVRAQGAFVADDEVQGLVDYLKENNDPPIYAQEVQARIDRAASEDGDEAEEGTEMGGDEKLYKQALDVLRASKRASTSMLQRRLSIGYNRAARIMEMMEDKGIVGPENGSSPREILVDLDNM